MRALRPLLLPTLAGVLYFLSWIGFGIWPLAFVCFVPLLVGLRGTTLRQAFGRGAWMGFVTHLGGYLWLVHMLRVFAFAPLWLAVLGYAAVCAAQGLLFGVVALLYRWLEERAPFGPVLLLPLALVAAEFAVPLLFQSYTGVALFPLLPLVQIADLGGVLLVSALQAVVNGALFSTWLSFRGLAGPPTGALAASLVSLAASGVYGFVRMQQVERAQQTAPTVAVGLAQPNVGELELHANPYASVRALWDQTAELTVRGAALVVWPEGGFNLRGVRLTDDGADLRGGSPVPVIAGVIRVAPGEVWNSAVMIDREGRITGHYDKQKLLAFGEYIPFGDWFPKLYEWSPNATHLTAGNSTAPLRLGRYLLGTFICYEDILPRFVRGVVADHGEGRPHALVNLTNDSWYGAFHEQEEHLMLAAMRSIEQRRWLLRATSTGISAFVDANGRIEARIARDTRAVAVRDVPMLSGVTVYERAGDWPGFLAWGVLVVVGVRSAAAGLRPRRRG